MTENGLLKEHGYIVTKVIQVRLSRDSNVTLVRLRSPFQAGDWIGPWSNKSVSSSPQCFVAFHAVTVVEQIPGTL